MRDSMGACLDDILPRLDLVDDKGRNLGPVKGMVLPQGEPMTLREATSRALPPGYTLVARS